MSDIKKYTFSQLGAAMASEGKNKDVHMVKYTDHVKAIEAKDKEIERLKEIIHLLKSSANSERLNKSIKAIKDGETFERELLE